MFGRSSAEFKNYSCAWLLFQLLSCYFSYRAVISVIELCSLYSLILPTPKSFYVSGVIVNGKMKINPTQ